MNVARDMHLSFSLAAWWLMWWYSTRFLIWSHFSLIENLWSWSLITDPRIWKHHQTQVPSYLLSHQVSWREQVSVTLFSIFCHKLFPKCIKIGAILASFSFFTCCIENWVLSHLAVINKSCVQPIAEWLIPISSSSFLFLDLFAKERCFGF